MKSIELANSLCSLIKKSSYRSILVDGPWGCGKTFEIKKFMDITKRKCVYISLFGLETIDEINTEIFKASHPTLIKTKKIITTISKAFSPVTYAGSISDALSFQLNNIDKTRIKNSLIIILDDIERLSKRIDYKDLVGYINKLFLSETRLICICSSNNIDSSRLQSFNQFKEKVFDCCLSVKQTDYAVYDEIFKDLEISNADLLYPLFDNNIRTAKRSYLFYKDLIEHFDFVRNKYSVTKYDLLKSSVYTVLCVLNSKPKPKPNDDFRIMLYDGFVDEYGEGIANGIYYYLKYGEESSVGNVHNVILSLIGCYLSRDFDSFEKEIRCINAQDKEMFILEKCPFYLSEENKKIYFDELNSYVDNIVVYTDETTRRVRDLYFYTQYVLSEARVKKLAEMHFKSIKKEYLTKSIISDFVFPGVRKRTGKITDFTLIFTNRYLEIFTMSITKSFYKAVNKDEYSKASDLIDKLINFESDDLIRKMLIDNNFFLEDLEKDISEARWSFTNSIAKVACKQSLSKEYINAVELYRDRFDGIDNTLDVRLLSLVNNNFNLNYVLKSKKPINKE